MKRNRIIFTAGAGVFALVLTACGGSSDSGTAAEAPSQEAAATQAAPSEAAASQAPASDVPSWCGPNEIVLGFTDGFGGNSWRLVTTESGRQEAALCPSVKELLYADGLKRPPPPCGNRRRDHRRLSNRGTSRTHDTPATPLVTAGSSALQAQRPRIRPLLASG